MSPEESSPEKTRSEPVSEAPGIGSSRTPRTHEKTVVLAPTPSASVSTATTVKPGVRDSPRMAYLRS